MKERPTLFSGAMVRAILADEKTVTRRIVKNPERHGCFNGDCPHETGTDCLEELLKIAPCQPGDLLWVRESIIQRSNYHIVDEIGVGRDVAEVVYAADEAPCPIDRWPWKRHVLPSIHMPYGAARIWLRVKDVRAEPIQEITNDDAEDEGTRQWCHENLESRACCIEHGFQLMWDSLNAGRGYPWSENPWVWRIEFDKVTDE